MKNILDFEKFINESLIYSDTPLIPIHLRKAVINVQNMEDDLDFDSKDIDNHNYVYGVVYERGDLFNDVRKSELLFSNRKLTPYEIGGLYDLDTDETQSRNWKHSVGKLALFEISMLEFIQYMYYDAMGRLEYADAIFKSKTYKRNKRKISKGFVKMYIEDNTSFRKDIVKKNNTSAIEILKDGGLTLKKIKLFLS